MELIVQAVVIALVEAANMAWEVLWPLILGFALSGAVRAVVSHRSMSRGPGGIARTASRVIMASEGTAAADSWLKTGASAPYSNA